MLSRDALVEHQRVGDDGAGHPAGLGNVGHPQQPGNLPGGGRGHLFQFVQDHRRPLDAVLQSVRRQFHFLLWDRHQPHQVRQVRNRPLQPARLREARVVLVQHAVGEPGVGNSLRYVIGVPHRLGIAQRNRRLNAAGLPGNAQSQSCDGVLLRLRSGFVLGFHHHRRPPRRGYQHIRVLPRMRRKSLRVLGAYLAAGHHAAQQITQGIVRVWLRLVRHSPLRKGELVSGV